MMNPDKILPVNELYYAIQGEGSRAGMPTVVIRTIGCNLRCQFLNGGFCDAWANSWKLEKGQYTLNDIFEMYRSRPDITEMMITGGGPTKHPELVKELVKFANENDIFVTMETEGSEVFDIAPYKIDLVSLSPKFSNSTPIEGSETPWGSIVTIKEVERHTKHRDNPTAIIKLMAEHSDYQFKPVYDGTDQTAVEIELFRQKYNIPHKKTWIMPAGDSRDKLAETYSMAIDLALRFGYNFTGRPHIIAYDTKRRV